MTEDKCELGIEGCDGSHGPLRKEAYDGYIMWFDDDNVFRHREDAGFNKRKRKRSNNGTIAIDNELSRIVLLELEAGGATAGSIAIARRLLAIASTDKGAQAVGALDRLPVRLGEQWERKPGPNETCKVCGRKASGAVHLTVTKGIGEDLRRFKSMMEDDGE